MKNIVLILCLFLMVGQSTAQEFREDFENWQDTLGGSVPNGWTAWPKLDTSLLNVERVDALTGNGSALSLKSIIPFFEGHLQTYLNRPFPFQTDSVRLSFKYKCEGEGSCSIYLFQGNTPTIAWSVAAGDTTVYDAFIDNISGTLASEDFTRISIIASPIITPFGHQGAAYLTIDSFSMENLSPITSTKDFDQLDEITLYPNPFQEKFYIRGLDPFDLSGIQVCIFNSHGAALGTFRGSTTIDLSNYSPGIYYAQIRQGDWLSYKKIVKVD